MSAARAIVPTPNGGKYVVQLCKHWAHKLEVEIEGTSGLVRFDGASAVMTADDEAITVTISSDDPATVERLKGVVATHLDRFAHREAPLNFQWVQTEI